MADIDASFGTLSLSSDPTLKQLLMTSADDPPDPLQRILMQRLTVQQEVLLYINDEALASTDWTALLEPPDSSAAESCTFSSTEAAAIMRTMTAICEAISASAGILFDPTKDANQQPPLPDRNDEAIDARWTAKGYRILVRHQASTAEDIQELRIAVCGNVDAGKSTLLGVLTKGRLDDGRGRARVALMRHKHEIETGRTSSVGLESGSRLLQRNRPDVRSPGLRSAVQGDHARGHVEWRGDNTKAGHVGQWTRQGHHRRTDAPCSGIRSAPRRPRLSPSSISPGTRSEPHCFRKVSA
jgi:hypothetical protein